MHCRHPLHLPHISFTIKIVAAISRLVQSLENYLSRWTCHRPWYVRVRRTNWYWFGVFLTTEKRGSGHFRSWRLLILIIWPLSALHSLLQCLLSGYCFTDYLESYVTYGQVSVHWYRRRYQAPVQQSTPRQPWEVGPKFSLDSEFSRKSTACKSVMRSH